MQVTITLDTEKESVEDLRRLQKAIDELIGKKLGIVSQPASSPSQPQIQKTSGGCRVVQYEDLSGMMTNIFSRRH